MALPPGIPTLEHMRSKNLTRPDNVFCTRGVRDHLRSCLVRSELRPIHTDHFPIFTEFDLPASAAAPRPRRDFRQVDWAEFDQALTARLATYSFPADYQTREAFDDALEHLMVALRETIEEQVPLTPDTPYAKRWWSAELTKMRKEKERLARIAHRH
ncbi:hypothetical protein FKP32DRAFT_1534857, partial [Trametes sanguinea]